MKTRRSCQHFNSKCKSHQFFYYPNFSFFFFNFYYSWFTILNFFKQVFGEKIRFSTKYNSFKWYSYFEYDHNFSFKKLWKLFIVHIRKKNYFEKKKVGEFEIWENCTYKLKRISIRKLNLSCYYAVRIALTLVKIDFSSLFSIYTFSDFSFQHFAHIMKMNFFHR